MIFLPQTETDIFRKTFDEQRQRSKKTSLKESSGKRRHQIKNGNGGNSRFDQLSRSKISSALVRANFRGVVNKKRGPAGQPSSPAAFYFFPCSPKRGLIRPRWHRWHDITLIPPFFFLPRLWWVSDRHAWCTLLPLAPPNPKIRAKQGQKRGRKEKIETDAEGNKRNRGGGKKRRKKKKNVENRRTDRVYDLIQWSSRYDVRTATKTTMRNGTTIQISIVYAGQPRIFF